MNEIDHLKSLDRDDAQAHDIDVTNAVLRTIRTRQRADADDAFLLPAIVATLAGGLAVLVILQLNLTDPFAGFLDAFNLVLQ